MLSKIVIGSVCLNAAFADAPAGCDKVARDACGEKMSTCEEMATLFECVGDAKCLEPKEDMCKEGGMIDMAIKAKECSSTCADMYDPGCFPSTAQVELKNGQTKSMDQLVVGDEVRVGPSDYSEVYFFSSQLSETTSKFVKLVTEYTELSLTSGHYLYVNGELLQAKHVKVGDVVVLGNGTKASVTLVDSSWAPGLYNPHTMHGDIVVDNVHTSTYTDAVHPKLAHALLSPIRAMHTAGVSYGQGFSGVLKGLPEWVKKAVTV